MSIFTKFLRLLRPAPACRHWEVLHKIPLFQTLSRRELGIVELILHERSYLGDEIIFEEGEEGLGMYIILEGNLRVVRRGILRKLTGNEEIAVLGPGESVGEMALLDGVKRSAAVVAKGPARVLCLFQPEFLQLLHTHRVIGFKVTYELARGMAGRIRVYLEQGPTNDVVV